MTLDTSLRIAVFLDTRPGHRKQTFGVIDSLRRLTEIETVEIHVPLLSTFGEIIKWVKYYFFPESLCEEDIKDYDLIIGTGSRTHIPMLACKKKYNIPVVTFMDPSSLLRKSFDLCFIPHHDNVPPGKNVFYTDGPPNRARFRNAHDPNRALILIGGMDEKSHRWDDAALNKEVSELVEKGAGLKWTISSSPRTPAETNKSMAQLAAKFNYVNFIPFAETGSGWIEQEYDRNKTVWVTADSISMMFEAMTAGCRVGVLPVAWKEKNNKFQRCVDNLRRKGLVVSFDDWAAGDKGWNISEPLNEAQRCAEEILKRWWPNRLQ